MYIVNRCGWSLFDRPPNESGAKLLPFFAQNQEVGIGEKSLHGRGGMDSKISAAKMAVAPGSQCRACVVLSGADLDSIRSVASKDYDGDQAPKGTLFATPDSELERQAIIDSEVLDVSSYQCFALVADEVFKCRFSFILLLNITDR